jgi:hypothetical protein
MHAIRAIKDERDGDEADQHWQCKGSVHSDVLDDDPVDRIGGGVKAIDRALELIKHCSGRDEMRGPVGLAAVEKLGCADIVDIVSFAFNAADLLAELIELASIRGDVGQEWNGISEQSGAA